MSDIEKQNNDFETECRYARYEDGKGVAEIALELQKSESYVYAKMRRIPEKYEDVKRVREENHNVKIRRVRGLADSMVLEYLEEMQADKEKAFQEIDRINRIGKDYAHRVQLAEGKATENLAVGGVGRPFKVLIKKTYITQAEIEG